MDTLSKETSVVSAVLASEIQEACPVFISHPATGLPRLQMPRSHLASHVDSRDQLEAIRLVEQVILPTW